MARLLGAGVVIRFLLGRCTLDDLIARVEKIMKTGCAVIRGCDPVITIDIDDLTSYEFSLRYAEYRRKGNEDHFSKHV